MRSRARGCGLIDFHGSSLRTGGRVVLIEVGLGNDLELDQLGVPRCVPLSQVVLRLCLMDCRDRRNVLLARRIEIRLCLCELRARLLDGDLVVARVKLQKELARIHRFIVIDVNGAYGSVDSRTDRIEIAVDLCIVGVLIRLQIFPELDSAQAQNCGGNRDQEQSRQPARPSALGRRGWMLDVVIFSRLVAQMRIVGMRPALKSFQPLELDS